MNTKIKKNFFVKVIIALTFTFALCYTFYYFYGMYTGFTTLRNYGKEIRQRQVQLLSKTDYQALLGAGREILSQVPIDNRTEGGHLIMGSFSVPEGVQIPKAIQDLQPRDVCIDYDGYLTIEMHREFGVRIYPENFQEPTYYYFEYGDNELIPGLWYYDEAYGGNHERIDQLIQEGKMRQKERSFENDANNARSP